MPVSKIRSRKRNALIHHKKQRPVRIVIASDSFKGTAESVEIAQALKRGIERIIPANPSSIPNMEFTIIPMADGGEGTLDAFEYVWKDSVRKAITVTGPNGSPVSSYWLDRPERSEVSQTSPPNEKAIHHTDHTALVELANTSGLLLANPLAPFACHSLGFGQALAAAIDAGAHKVYAGIGGSASTDGGFGLLSALGVRFYDQAGKLLLPDTAPYGNAVLPLIETVDSSAMRSLPPGGISVISDVSSPLLGPSGAAAVFGPQKGAHPEDIPILERHLRHFSDVLKKTFVNADPTHLGTGAAGGCGFALHAIGAELLPGSLIVSETLGLAEAVHHADIVITGEGRFDDQSAKGKAVFAVKALADAADVPTVLVAGGIESDTSEFAAAFSLTDLAGGTERAISDPLRWLEVVGEEIAATFMMV